MPKNLITIPPHAMKVINAIENQGFEAWCVGGCVRDSLLGLTPFDWDITTSALPCEILNSCKNFHTAETGIKHGTVTVISDGFPVEVTTYRSDSGYADHRHPSEVTFSRCLTDDLSRRDFTVNAIAYHPTRGLVDEFGGINDLSNRIIRCVGDPNCRFDEDALRILRCLRFASVLEFDIEPDTANAVLANKSFLLSISHERIRDELTKLLCGAHAVDILRQYADVFFTVMPELSSMANCAQETPYHRYDVWEHTLHAVSFVPQEPSLRWATLLHDCGKPYVKFFDSNGIAHFHGHATKSTEIASEILKRLRFSNSERNEILTLIAYHGERPPLPEKRIKKLLGSLGEETVFKLFTLMKGDLSAKSDGLFEERISTLEECETTAHKIIFQNECLSLKNLKINGSDLISIGFKKGPYIGQTLNQLLDEVLEGTLENEKDALINRAQHILNNQTP